MKSIEKPLILPPNFVEIAKMADQFGKIRQLGPPFGHSHASIAWPSFAFVGKRTNWTRKFRGARHLGTAFLASHLLLALCVPRPANNEHWRRGRSPTKFGRNLSYKNSKIYLSWELSEWIDGQPFGHFIFQRTHPMLNCLKIMDKASFLCKLTNRINGLLQAPIVWALLRKIKEGNYSLWEGMELLRLLYLLPIN